MFEDMKVDGTKTNLVDGVVLEFELVLGNIARACATSYQLDEI